MRVIKLDKKENFNSVYDNIYNKGYPQDLDFFVQNFKFGKDGASETWTVSIVQNLSIRMSKYVHFNNISFSKDDENLYISLSGTDYVVKLKMIDYIVLDLENFNKINIFEKYSGKEYRLEKQGYNNPFKDTKIQY